MIAICALALLILGFFVFPTVMNYWESRDDDGTTEGPGERSDW